MNERINDLRLEAGIGRLHEVPYMVAVNKEGELIEPLEGLQKFAELIVEECCNRLGEETILHDGYGYNQHELYNRLRKHFGVEL